MKLRMERGEREEIKKGPWKAEEDEVLINHVNKYGPRDWSSIRSKGLLQRTGKSCRLRWVNKLRPNLKKYYSIFPFTFSSFLSFVFFLCNKHINIPTSHMIEKKTKHSKATSAVLKLLFMIMKAYIIMFIIVR